MPAPVVMACALLSPLLALALLLWLSHLEETLPRDVERSRRRPAPPPVLAIPVVDEPAVTAPVWVPAQRPAPAAEQLLPDPVVDGTEPGSPLVV
jgi:hypothetical protein